MGLLFNRKNSEGNIIDRKRVDDNSLSHRDIREIARNVHGDHDTRRAVAEIMDSAKRSGDIDRSKIHEGIQKKIAEGEFSREKGEEIARELGLENKRFRYFEDESEYRDRHQAENNLSEERNQGIRNFERSGDPSAIPVKKKSIWSFLNNKKY